MRANSNALGERVRRLRGDLGLTLPDAARRASLTEKAWEQIEAGERTPTLGEALAITAALGCFVSTVLGHGEFQDRLETSSTESIAGAERVIEELGFYLETKSRLRDAGFEVR